MSEKIQQKMKEGEGEEEKEGGREEREEREEERGTPSLRESNHDMIGCKICFEEVIGVAVLPCGHAFMCVKCAERLALRECSICRRLVVKVVKIYLV